MTKKVIFDFGANKGQNIEYFLKNSDLVVAVEPVPEFCTVISEKFSKEIGNRLVVVNAFVTDDENKEKTIPFFVSKSHPGLSTFLDRSGDETFSQIQVNTVSASSLIFSILDKDDVLEYIKIDCEGADGLILDSLITSKLIPNYLSIELHSADIFNKVMRIGQFMNFRIEDAGKINNQFLGISPRRYLKFLRQDKSGKMNSTLHFSPISSGPFGIDLTGRWLNKVFIARCFAVVGTGSKDLHASQTRMSEHNEIALLNEVCLILKSRFKGKKVPVKNQLRKLLPKLVYSFIISGYRAILTLSPGEIKRERIRKKFIDFK